jgi:alpha-amylase
LFGIEPTVFRNTELIYSNELAAFMQSMGYKAILCEGLQRILNGRSPNHVYTVPGLEYIRLLLRNVNLSDDIAFRFGESRWSEYPLTAEKFAGWVHKQAADSTTINIFIDYETFGLHKKTETGIMQFLRQLPEALFLKDGMYFSTPSSIINTVTQAAPYDVPETISWEDRSKENCVYCETMHQNNALHKLYGLEKIVKAYEEEDVLKQWGLLQCADYLYYMNDDKMDYEAHPYRQNPFSCKEEAYRNFINILTDFEISLIKRGLIKIKQPIQDIHIY